jgi:hypothetical protein
MKIIPECQKQYCPYPECKVRYFEHYHIDRDTITFLNPEELEKLNGKSENKMI